MKNKEKKPSVLKRLLPYGGQIEGVGTDEELKEKSKTYQNVLKMAMASEVAELI